ncbi:MAG: archaeal proteasome endopeptidase complex subunit alpha [Candidatus Aenigmarchaeota archaeon]|nr:archaeal proteasome endopeptidase complex subunit alpha [Candidatus Aenigmarchaeota archaeon]
MAQPIPPNYMAYDRTIVVFSPDGRLLQVEYARQMVKNGSTSLGVRFSGGVVLAALKISVPLAVLESYKKIYEIDDHIAAVSSGSLADARSLIDMGRVRAQINRITYGEQISIGSVTKYISNRKHLVTQYAGVRPYGVGMLIGGIDKTGARLYETEPSGTMIEWKAQAIGRGAEKAKKILEKGHKESIEEAEAIRLAIRALKAGEKEASAENTEIVSIGKGKMQKLTSAELKKYFASSS